MVGRSKRRSVSPRVALVAWHRRQWRLSTARDTLAAAGTAGACDLLLQVVHRRHLLSTAAKRGVVQVQRLHRST